MTKIIEKIQEVGENIFKTIFDELPIGIEIIQDNEVKYINQGIVNMFGYTIEEMIQLKAQKFIKMVHSDYNELIIEQARKKQEEKDDFLRNYQFQDIKKTGKSIWIKGFTKSINYEGRPAELVSFIDITEKVEAVSKLKESYERVKLLNEELKQKFNIRSQELKESKEKYRLITENAHALIAILNSKFEHIFINEKTYLKILGYSNKDIIGKKRWDLIHHDDLEKSIKGLNEGFKTGIGIVESRLKHKDGHYIWFEFQGKRYIDKEGKAMGIIIGRDITERKQMEELKTKMLTRLSHEFKTPLVSIKGNVDLLLKAFRDKLGHETVSILLNAREGCNRLQGLINSFVESVKLGGNIEKLDLKERNLTNLIKSCLEELESLVRLRKHVINLDIEKELTIKLDEEKIKEVIINILLNSIKYTPPEGIISINSTKVDNFILISVNDNGIGLTEDEKGQLFKPFGKIERYGHGWDIISQGSGMGLYISKELIELHGGEIWVESDGRNKGSTFYFLLPLLK